MTRRRGHAALQLVLAILDRFWWGLVLAVDVTLAVFVFAPRGMTAALLVCAIVAAGVAVAVVSSD